MLEIYAIALPFIVISIGIIFIQLLLRNKMRKSVFNDTYKPNNLRLEEIPYGAEEDIFGKLKPSHTTPDVKLGQHIHTQPGLNLKILIILICMVITLFLLGKFNFIQNTLPDRILTFTIFSVVLLVILLGSSPFSFYRKGFVHKKKAHFYTDIDFIQIYYRRGVGMKHKTYRFVMKKEKPVDYNFNNIITFAKIMGIPVIRKNSFF